MTKFSQINRLIGAAFWLSVHALLLAIFRDHVDYLPTIFDRYSTVYAGGMVLLALMGVLGAVMIVRNVRFQLPAWLAALRRSSVFYIGTIILGTLIIAAYWLNALYLTPLQRELLRS